MKRQGRKKVSTSFSILPDDRAALEAMSESLGVGVNGLIESAIKHLIKANPNEIKCPTCGATLRKAKK